MPVIFKCTCKQYLAVPNKYSGKKLQCSVCKAIISVPTYSEKAENEKETDANEANSEEIHSDQTDRCKYCGAWITSNKLEHCPLCGKEINIS